jgi:hypothetical protein
MTQAISDERRSAYKIHAKGVIPKISQSDNGESLHTIKTGKPANISSSEQFKRMFLEELGRQGLVLALISLNFSFMNLRINDN